MENPCDSPNCNAEAIHVHTVGIGFAMYCETHYQAAEADRLSRIRRENAMMLARRGGSRG